MSLKKLVDITNKKNDAISNLEAMNHNLAIIEKNISSEDIKLIIHIAKSSIETTITSIKADTSSNLIALNRADTFLNDITLLSKFEFGNRVE